MKNQHKRLELSRANCYYIVMNNNLKKAILLTGDIGILYASLYLTLLVRYLEQPSGKLWGDHIVPFSIIFLVWIITFYISNLYDLRLAINNTKFLQTAGSTLFVSMLLSFGFFYLTPQINIAPKTNLFIYIIVFSIFFILWRRLFNWLLGSYLPKTKIAFIGYNEQVKELVDEFALRPHLGYRVQLIISEDDIPAGDKKFLVAKFFDDLKKYIIEQNIDTVVLTTDPHYSDELRNVLFDCLPLKINFISLPKFYEIITGKIPIEVISKMWFFENLNEGSKKWFDIIKRSYDLLLAVFILIFTSPFWLVISLLIKLDSKGPVFFLSIRKGKNDQIFNLVKFRTMRVNDNDLAPTASDDPRITKFGRFLRKSRLDEIPQMINIINGELSFVGPRPERPELIKGLEEQIPFYRERMLVKPGATGWDQVSGEYHSPSVEDTLKKLQYDLFYIKNRSIYLDISIILKTIRTILIREGI
jgi:exopolysaccharide biosynthesis polyprenyl glycosylphosphotransferase